MQYAHYSDLPGYSEAARNAFEKQQGIRERSIVGGSELIAGFNLRFVSLRNYTALRWMQNGLVTSGKSLTHIDACFFVWIHCKEYRDCGGWLRTLRNKYFRRRISWRMSESKLREIESWCYEQFQDFDRGDGSQSAPAPSTGETAWIVEALAHEYGWSDEIILDMPIARITQYLRLMRQRNDSKYTPYQLTDRVNDEYAAKWQRIK